jgi:hypothetical protein
MRVLVANNALASSSLPTYLSNWMNVLSSMYVYTTTQTTKFHESHLQVGIWYLNCSRGFVLREKKNIFLLAWRVVLRKITFSLLKSPTLLSFVLLRPKHQRERVEQRIPPLKPLPALSLGMLQRPMSSHPPSYGVHLTLSPLLHQLPSLVLPQPFVHKLLLLLLTVAFFFSLCFARGRPPSWIRVPPLRSRLTRLPSSKIWTWCNTCWILSLKKVPTKHIHASRS